MKQINKRKRDKKRNHCMREIQEIISILMEDIQVMDMVIQDMATQVTAPDMDIQVMVDMVDTQVMVDMDMVVTQVMLDMAAIQVMLVVIQMVEWDLQEEQA